uniref:NADH-ubiquinone oxidoreductase chain 2 n=1 Tax=Rhynchocinetes durbanensis TaxID=516932 RepID=A0A0X9U7M8_9EUCA|nr:NADH dehydrogenase subunit 2 [Rhynchocinetes durbanensis]AMA20520.1 NADH dehydrogenase subunit 2 [Rhynchocinetes durbanensis]
MSFPSRLTFMSSLIIGILIAISASSWLTAWLGLELNLMSFIPLMHSKKNLLFVKASLKYFLIQAMGSVMIIWPSMFFFPGEFFSSIFIFSALLLKIGAAPFHFWLPSVCQGISWAHCATLLTIQKIAPLALISWILPLPSIYMLLAALLSSLIGSIGGFGQKLLRKIMAYSSINHMAWMLSAMNFSQLSFLIYFFTYSVISVSIMIMFHVKQTFHLSQLYSSNPLDPMVKLVIFLSLFSLGGVPPFVGFSTKWLIISNLVFNKSFLWLSFLIFTALITLFFYLRISMNSFMLLYTKMKFASAHPHDLFIVSSLSFNLFPFFIWIGMLSCFF